MENTSSEKTLEVTSQMFDVPDEHIVQSSRDKKATIGLPPHKYIIHRRIERAKLLLAGTKKTLSAVAHATGFANESHLVLHFKHLTGLTPKHYRNK